MLGWVSVLVLDSASGWASESDSVSGLVSGPASASGLGWGSVSASLWVLVKEIGSAWAWAWPRSPDRPCQSR